MTEPTSPDHSPDPLLAEFERLGIPLRDLPGIVLEGGPGDWFLVHLRTLQPGATLQDILPGSPPHWRLGQPATWTIPYYPLGPWDYQETPLSPAIHILWEGPEASDWLSSLAQAAEAQGHAIHGFGHPFASRGGAAPTDGCIVLNRDTSPDALDAALTWLAAQPHVRVAVVLRTSQEDASFRFPDAT
jgi:hypothetical protein